MLVYQIHVSVMFTVLHVYLLRGLKLHQPFADWIDDNEGGHVPPVADHLPGLLLPQMMWLYLL